MWSQHVIACVSSQKENLPDIYNKDAIQKALRREMLVHWTINVNPRAPWAGEGRQGWCPSTAQRRLAHNRTALPPGMGSYPPGNHASTTHVASRPAPITSNAKPSEPWAGHCRAHQLPAVVVHAHPPRVPSIYLRPYPSCHRELMQSWWGHGGSSLTVTQFMSKLGLIDHSKPRVPPIVLAVSLALPGKGRTGSLAAAQMVHLNLTTPNCMNTR